MKLSYLFGDETIELVQFDYDTANPKFALYNKTRAKYFTPAINECNGYCEQKASWNYVPGIVTTTVPIKLHPTIVTSDYCFDEGSIDEDKTVKMEIDTLGSEEKSSEVEIGKEYDLDDETVDDDDDNLHREIDVAVKFSIWFFQYEQHERITKYLDNLNSAMGRKSIMKPCGIFEYQ
jgi:hypothetical protein